MTQVSVVLPAPIAAPRGAAWAARAYAAVARALGGLWNDSAAAEREGARGWSRGREAAALRRYAARMSAVDPSFAADLYAAADRHLERPFERH